MAQISYIPAPDAGYSDWLLNFATLISAAPTAYGLVASDATAIAAQNSLYQAAYTLATNPTTRTAPNVAAKDVARAASEAVARPYAIRVRNNAAVSDALKVGLGLTVPKTVQTPVPAPTSAPSLTLVRLEPGLLTYTYADVATPVGKSKPNGVVSLQLWRLIPNSDPAAPAEWAYVDEVTKAPNQLALPAAWLGLPQTLRARWGTRSGPAGTRQFGPWSTELTFHST